MKNQLRLLERKVVIIAGITFACLLLLTLSWNQLQKQVRHDRAETILSAEERNSNLAVALEQYAIRTLQNGDAVLQLAIKERSNHTGHWKLQNLLKEPFVSGNAFAAIGVVDPQGEQLTFYKSQKEEQDTVKSYDYFRVHAETGHTGLYVGKPIPWPSAGHYVIPLSRRVESEDGRFGGVVVLLLEPASLTRFYAQANLRDRDIMSFIALDGTTYARRTGARESHSENIIKSPLFTHVARRPIGTYFARDAIRGVPSYFSYRRLKNYPMIATVGSAEEDVLANFQKRTLQAYGSAVVISILIVLFAILAGYFLLARRKNEERIRESEARYRSFFENSLDALLIIHPNGTVKAANPAACTLFGYSEEELYHNGRESLVDSTDPRFDEFVQQRNETGRARGEFSLIRKDGSIFTAEVASATFMDADGQKLATIMIRDLTQQKRLQKKLLKEQKRFQRQLTAQVISAQEREREAIGRELHDNVNQVLTTVKLYLELAITDKAACDTLLPKSIGYVLHSINEIRKLSHSLTAPTLGTKSLIDSVNALIEMMRASSNLRIAFRHVRCEEHLSMELKLAVYRILQEQLNNVVKHAKASKVLVSLGQRPGYLTLSVKDNGQGFDADKKREGIGINNIISRAKVFGGRVTLNTQPGKGCHFLVEIPIAEQGPEKEARPAAMGVPAPAV